MKGSVLLGHSLGEYVAACIAGVFSLPDACRLVAARGKLMERARGGAMLAVALDEARVKRLCVNGVDLAAVNGAQQCVLSGDAQAIAVAEAELSKQGHWVRRLGVSYGFHSHLLDPVLDEFEAILRSVKLQAPHRRMISSVTGTWLGDAEATNPSYWCRQMRAPVRFWEGLRTLATSERVLCFEMGPGQTVSGLARGAGLATQAIWPTGKDEEESTARALASAWEKGVEVDWRAVHGPGRRRVELPGVVFDRQRHWLEPKAAASITPTTTSDKPRLYAPVWRRWLTNPGPLPTGPYLVVQGGLVSTALRAAGRTVIEVEAGADYGQVLATLRKDGIEPKEIVHTLAVDAAESALLDYFHDVHTLVRALIGAGVVATLTILTRGSCAVTDLEQVAPELAALRGLMQVVPQEHPQLRCRHIDIASRESETAIVEDLGLPLDQPLVARRGRQLWVPDNQEVKSTTATSPLRHGGTYLITGGLGAIGLAIAQHLAQNYKAKIALVSRTSAPTDGRLRAIEQMAGGLLVGSVDVADAAAMRAFASTVEVKLGPLNGVIHAAGIVGQAARLPFATAARGDIEALMRAKLSGTRVIDRLFADRPLDFVCLMSSLAVELGGPGLGPYAAANAALDAFAGERSGTPWITINWDGWKFDVDGPGIEPAAGVSAWEDALGSGNSQVAVVLGDFAARLSRWQKPRPVSATPATKPAVSLNSRTEIAVARAWEAVLGRANLGPGDDFFDLGGDSLRAAQVLNRLRGDLGSDIPMRLLFEAPSVAAFSAAIDRLPATAAARMEVEF